MLRTFTKYLFKTIRLILGLALVGQVFVIALHMNNQQNPLHQIVQQQIHQTLSNYNLTFQCKKISVSLNSRLDIREPRIYYQNGKRPLLSADHFNVYVNPFKLALGKLDLCDISLHDATVLCPAVLSPTGLNQELIHNLHASIKFKGKSPKIEFINFNLDNLTVTAQGSVKQKNSKGPSISNKNTSPRQLFLTLQTILAQKQHLSQFENPIVSINLIPTLKQTIIDTEFHAQKFEFKDIELGPHYAHLQFLFSEGSIKPYRSAFFQTNQLNYKKSFRAGPSFFKAPLPSNLEADNIIPHKINAIFTDPHYNHLTADTVHYNGPINLAKPRELAFTAVTNREWVKATAEIDFDKKTLEILADGAVHPQSLRPILSPAVNKIVQPLTFTQEPQLHASISFGENFAFKELDLHLNAKHTEYQHLKLNHCFTKTLITPRYIDIQFAHLNNKTTNVEGSYYQEYASNDYRFLLAGMINPELLNPWMSPAWSRFWNNFELNSPFPYADWDIQGNWSKPKNNKSFVLAKASNFNYLNTPFDSADLRLFITPRITRLIDIDAKTEGTQELKGNLELNYSPYDKNPLERIYVQAKSTFPLPYLANITGFQETKDVTAPIRCDSSPLINVIGAIYPGQNQNDIFAATLYTPDALTYYNIPLDRLDTKVYYTPQLTRIEDTKIGFANGAGTAEATITKHNEDQFLTIKLNIDNANPRNAIANIKSLGHEDDNLGATKASANIFTNDRGLAHIDLQATGKIGDLTSYSGDGNINITQSDLGKVHLFGIFSKLLDTTPLALGTFKLTDISAPFKIQNNHVYFPDLNIYGPTANIAAHGNYTISNNDLNFKMNIAPLGKIRIPLVSHAFMLFSSIAQSFQVQIDGTLEDPIWQINITPFGLFKKKSSTGTTDTRHQK